MLNPAALCDSWEQAEELFFRSADWATASRPPCHVSVWLLNVLFINTDFFVDSILSTLLTLPMTLKSFLGQAFTNGGENCCCPWERTHTSVAVHLGKLFTELLNPTSVHWAFLQRLILKQCLFFYLINEIVLIMLLFSAQHSYWKCWVKG